MILSTHTLPDKVLNGARMGRMDLGGVALGGRLVSENTNMMTITSIHVLYARFCMSPYCG